ncbi:hypothetical protein Tco_0043702 [Tanacetum coccineum]
MKWRFLKCRNKFRMLLYLALPSPPLFLPFGAQKSKKLIVSRCLIDEDHNDDLRALGGGLLRRGDPNYVLKE